MVFVVAAGVGGAGGARGQTQGLTHAKHVLCQRHCIPRPVTLNAIPLESSKIATTRVLTYRPYESSMLFHKK